MSGRLPFVGFEDAIETFYGLIGDRMGSSPQQVINASYFAVVQSSGTGSLLACLHEIKHFKYSAFQLLHRE